MNDSLFDLPVGDHNKCPFHDDQTGSLAVWINERGEKWAKCHAGCGNFFIDSGHEPGEAKGRPSFGKALPRDIDQKKHASLCSKVLRGIDDVELQLLFSLELERRKISKDICVKYGVWPTRDSRGLPYCCFSIRDRVDRLVGAKLHRIGRHEPKCLWYKLVSAGSNAVPELFPNPVSQLDKGERSIVLVPGELKALRILSLGYQATSPTTGEGVDLSPNMIEDLQGRNVILLGDLDDVKRAPSGVLKCPGASWAISTAEQLRAAGIPVTLSSCGRVGP